MTLSEILKAVHTCTASVHTVQDQLGGLQVEVWLLQQDLQKISQGASTVESHISNIKDKLPSLLAETCSASYLAKANNLLNEAIENHIRWNNVKIVCTGGKVPTDFIE